MQRCRVRAAAWAMLGDVCEGGTSGKTGNRGMRSAQFTHTDLGEVVYLAGNTNYAITDNDLLGSYIIIHTGRNPGSQGKEEGAMRRGRAGGWGSREGEARGGG